MRTTRLVILGLSAVCLLGTAGALTLWLGAVVLSDRFPWSQSLSFVPRHWFVWPAGVGWSLLLVFSTVYAGLRPRAEGLPWRSERRGRGRLVRGLAKARVVLGVLTLAATLHLVVVEWRWPLNLGTGAPPGERFRVVYWNVGWSHPVEVMDSLVVREPDLAIITNPLTREDLHFDFDLPASQMGPAAWVRQDWPINVVSRWPVRRWGVTQLGFTSRVNVIAELRSDERPPVDPGRAMFVEIDVGAPLERTVAVWILDFPSDPALHRPAVVRQALERIAAWIGPDEGRFPAPDIVIGDLNIPAGSASLDLLRRGDGRALVDAHAQGGIGPAPSWPADRPLLRIDQCFIGPGLRAARYRIEPGGDTRHRMQVVDVVGEGAEGRGGRGT